MADRQIAHDGKIWVDGLPIEGHFTLEVHNDLDAEAYGDALEPADLATSIEVSKTLTVEDPAEHALLEGLGARRFLAEFEIERDVEIPPGTKFALWGGRRRWVQIGSVRDFLLHARSVRVRVPNVELGSPGPERG